MNENNLNLYLYIPSSFSAKLCFVISVSLCVTFFSYTLEGNTYNIVQNMHYFLKCD